MNRKTYTQLISIPTFKERFEYLKTNSKVGEETFGSHRYLNQRFYKSDKWIKTRNEIIVRDKGLDLGCEGFDINSNIIVHHINPITIDDILNLSDNLFDPENLISTSEITHKALHYGNINSVPVMPVERHKNDTCPWL